jgi:hypothetical protein
MADSVILTAIFTWLTPFKLIFFMVYFGGFALNLSMIIAFFDRSDLLRSPSKNECRLLYLKAVIASIYGPLSTLVIYTYTGKLKYGAKFKFGEIASPKNDWWLKRNDMQAQAMHSRHRRGFDMHEVRDAPAGRCENIWRFI